MAELAQSAEYVVVNEGKQELIEVDSQLYRRLVLRTHVIEQGEDLAEVAAQYAQPLLQEGDVIFITEKIVGISQGRAIPVDEIKPSRLALFLVRFVYKNPHGVGLSLPETMEMALRECGRLRILLAAFVSAIGKLLGKRGWFYKVAGYKAASIDGPADYLLERYNRCVVLSPENPEGVAKHVSQAMGCPVIVTDINDLGGEILGAYPPTVDRLLMTRILKDNPLGQARQQTPLGIIRTINNCDSQYEIC